MSFEEKNKIPRERGDSITPILVVVQWITTTILILWCFLSLSNRLEVYSDYTDKLCEAQQYRTNRLYEMFIDLLKEGRK